MQDSVGARLHTEDRPGGVRILTLEHPARRNALDDGVLLSLREALDAGATAHVRAILVRGAGERSFCAGYDLTRLEEAPEEGPLPDALLLQVLAELERHPAPSVALVQGPAYGAGCDLALACDFRVGGPHAVFCMPPARLGIIYGADGLRRLSAATRLPFAKWMFLTGTPVEAGRAHAEGLLDALGATEAEAEAQALALCTTLAERAPLAVAGMKEAFGALGRGALGPAEEARLEARRRAAYRSEDAREGRQAFVEKRPPRFQGR